MPAGDIGVGAREIGYLFGQYKRLRNEFTGVLTGKGLTYGGCLARTEATGYGLCYFTDKMLQDAGRSFEGATVVISGSGNVAIYACEKATELGAKVVAMSDSNGYVYDRNGIDLAAVKQLKEVERKRIREYVETHPSAEYHEGCAGIWQIPCDIALPCATQNELDENAAKALIKNGCFAVAEGANMPCTPEAVAALQACRTALRPRQGGQRRRCGHLRPGDEPELHALLLDLRRGGRAPQVHHDQSVPQRLQCRRGVRQARRPGGRRQHRGLPEGGRRHAGLRLGVRRAAE